jgi:hypothetical protein
VDKFKFKFKFFIKIQILHYNQWPTGGKVQSINIQLILIGDVTY